MSAGKRITLAMLDDETQALINASASIMPVNEAFLTADLNPDGYDFIRILDGTEKNNIYAWDIDTWSLIGADDKVIAYSELSGVPSTFAPATHSHTESDISNLDKYTQSATNTLLLAKVDKVTGKALSTNDFTDLLKTKLDNLTDSSAVVSALETHKTSNDHDGRYFTESEVTTLLSGKADSSTVSGHTGNTTVHTTAEEKVLWNGISNKVDKVAGKELSENDFTDTLKSKLDLLTEAADYNYSDAISAITTHKTSADHDGRYFTESEVTTMVNNAISASATVQSNLTTHASSADHDGRYFTESEVTTALSGKTDSSAFTGHTGNTTVHTNQTEKDAWNAKEPAITTKNTAFNKNYGTTATDVKINGTQAVGSVDAIARIDHVHPTDTSREPSLPSKTGNVGKALIVSVGETALEWGEVKGGSGIAVSTTEPVDGEDFWFKEISSAVIGDELVRISTSDDVPQGSTNLYATTAEKATWNGKANVNAPTFTGVPAAGTAAANTNTTQLATTAFVVGQAGTANPTTDGTATVGTSLRYSREDHVHPVHTLSYNAKLSADVQMPTSGTWADGPSLSLPAGTYLVSAFVTMMKTATTAAQWFARISDGTNHYASSNFYHASLANISGNIQMSTIITLATTTTIKLQGTTSAGATTELMKAAVQTYGAGNNATQISAIRID